MGQFEVHPSVQDDLKKAPPPDPAHWMSDTRMDVFLEDIEVLSARPDYRKVWPERIPSIGEQSRGATFAPAGSFTLYAWLQEGFVICLEERLNLSGELKFRWLLCLHGVAPASAISEAIELTRTPW